MPLADYPVFVREGAIVPLAVETGATGHGESFSSGHLTVAVFPAPPGSEHEGSHFELPEEGRRGGIRLATARVASRGRAKGPAPEGRPRQDALELTASPTDRPLLWRIRAASDDAAPDPRVVRDLLGPDPVRVESTAALTSAPRTWTRGPEGTLWIRVADPHPRAGVRLRLGPGREAPPFF